MIRLTKILLHYSVTNGPNNGNMFYLKYPYQNTVMSQLVECPIWGTPAEKIPTDNSFLPKFYSARTNGDYRIRSDQRSSIRELLDDRGKARLTTWLINQRNHGVRCPNVTRQAIEIAQNARDMSVMDRMNRVILFFEESTDRGPMGGLAFNPHPTANQLDDQLDNHVTTYYQLLAYSESISWDSGLSRLVDYLSKNGFINKIGFARDNYYIELEMSGFERLEQLRPEHPDSDRVFVAMWFNNELDNAYSDGFKRAIEEAGYRPLRIDKENFTGKIDDQIISEIRRSRFVVADFSKGDDGARGGVYYEAGFAHGLGLEVIFTCRKEDIDDLHFDTRQYNHIVWEDIDDLRTQLENRITAAIGDGPYRSRG